MNTLDMVYIGILAVSLIVSSLRGGVRELFSLAAIVAGFMAAAHFYEFGSGLLLRLTSHENINSAISFILIFMFVAILVSYIGGQLTHIVQKADMGSLNFLAGSAIGLVKGLFICTLITYIMLVFMKTEAGFFSGSKGFPLMSRLTLAVSPIGPKHFREELDKKLDELYAKGAKEADSVADTLKKKKSELDSEKKTAKASKQEASKAVADKTDTTTAGAAKTGTGKQSAKPAPAQLQTDSSEKVK